MGKQFWEEKERESLKCHSRNGDGVEEDSDCGKSGYSGIDSGNEPSIITKKRNRKVKNRKLDTTDVCSDGDNAQVDHVNANVEKKKRKVNDLEEASEVGEDASKKHTIEEVKGNFEPKKKEKVKGKRVKNGLEKPSKPRKVKFSDRVEVFLLSDDDLGIENSALVQGKRFSPEEDEIIKKAVFDCIKAHDLGDVVQEDSDCGKSGFSGNEPSITKKRKRKVKNHNLDSTEVCSDGDTVQADYVNANVEKKKKRKVNDLEEASEVEKDSSKKHTIEPKKKEKVKSKRVKNGLEKPSKPKKVKFSDRVEEFPLSDDDLGIDETNALVQGKRFSPEEDEIIKKAVFDCIKAHDLGDDGLKMIMRCKKFPKLKNVWKEIRAAIPWRPRLSVYQRAHVIFESDTCKSWTPEQLVLLKRFTEKNGTANMRVFGESVGKHWRQVSNAWKRIRLPNLKRGHWSQDEYQTLFDLVNTDLAKKAFEKRETRHGMLRDNIAWTAISQELATRTDPTCCLKWYRQLSSPMVAQGKWNCSDDYYLVDALVKLDACCIDDVDWDNLLEHRSGDVCRERWNQMVRHIGEHTRSFSEEVDILSKRYLPDMIEARVAYESKPAV